MCKLKNNLAKHLAKLLSPLSTSDYTVSSTEDLVDFLKHQKVPDDCDLISFDVTSLFTNVPLQFTIDIILRKVYEEKLIKTNIPRKEMKDLLLLCTNNVHFTYEGKVYQQLDGVAMESPLGPVIAGIFMVELESTTIPRFHNSLSLWKRYVDDTLCFVKKGCREHVLSVLNSFHTNIKFTYEEERNNMISLLDVLLIRKADCHRSSCFSQRNKYRCVYQLECFCSRNVENQYFENVDLSSLPNLYKRLFTRNGT